MSTVALVETKVCSGPCGLEKPLDAFAWKNRAKGYRQSRCKTCQAGANRDSRTLHLEDARVRDRDYHAGNREARNERRRGRYDKDRQRLVCISSVYGITVEQYNEMLERQGGVCAICKSPETVTRKGTLRVLTVDHDHETGVVRGLLCLNCNTGLGHFGDNPEMLSAASDYLKESVRT